MMGARPAAWALIGSPEQIVPPRIKVRKEINAVDAKENKIRGGDGMAQLEFGTKRKDWVRC